MQKRLWLWISCLFLPSLVHFYDASVRGAEGTFCSRTESNAGLCPIPPTFDEIDLEAYLGQWYEIGSTASFKLLTEVGLVCDQALYSITKGDTSEESKITLVNSGLKAVGLLATAEVATISIAARGVCSSARGVCKLVDSKSIDLALQKLAKVANKTEENAPAFSHEVEQICKKISASIEDVGNALDSLSGDISQIQFLAGQVGQANVSVESGIDEMKEYIKDAELERARLLSTAKDLEAASTLLQGMIGQNTTESENVELREAAEAFAKVAKQIAAAIPPIQLSLGSMKAAASALLLNGSPISDGSVQSVRGQITQNATSHGKLSVTIFGVGAPYWVLAVDGEASEGYKAALVYSCSNNKLIGESKSLFILSRKPELDRTTVDRFLSLAYSYGIYTDCDDPFLFTVQRGDDCGKPNIASS